MNEVDLGARRRFPRAARRGAGRGRRCRLRPAVAKRLVSAGAGRRRDPEPPSGNARHRAQGDGAGVHASRPVAVVSQQRHVEPEQSAVPGARCQRFQRTTDSKSTALSRNRAASRSPSCGRCPSRTQITRHDCVEGWSAIGKWKGARLSALLDLVLPSATARYRGIPLRRSDGTTTERRRTTRASTWTTRITSADDPRLHA